MSNTARGAAPHKSGGSRPLAIVWALLLVIATTGCAAPSAAPPKPTATPAPSPTPAPPATATPAYSNAAVIEKYRSRLPQMIRENSVPGLALAVVDDQQVIWAEGFGVTDGPGSRPVTADTLFSVQSMSKHFTAIAVLMAARDGVLDMNAPITTYLPWFRVNSIFEERPEQKMTLTTLLGHTAGFTHEAPVGNNEDLGPATFEAHIRSIADTWLMFPVGQAYHYSNNGPDLAGYILQQQAGRPFAQYMQEKLLDPMGMTHSTFDITRIEQTADRAIGHDKAVTTVPVPVPMLPAGGLYTTANDMAKYVQFNMNWGVVDGGARLAPQSLLEEICAPPSPPTRAQEAGYGVFVGRRHGTYFIGTGGGGFGFLSHTFWYPELKLGIVLLTNSANHDLADTLDVQIMEDLIADPNTIFHARAQALHDATPAPWETRPAAAAPPTPDVPALIRGLALPTPTQDPPRWAGYVGVYEFLGWGQARVSVEVYAQDHRLYAKVPQGVTALTEVRPGVFYADNGEALDLRGPIPIFEGIRFTKVGAAPPTSAP